MGTEYSVSLSGFIEVNITHTNIGVFEFNFKCVEAAENVDQAFANAKAHLFESFPEQNNRLFFCIKSVSIKEGTE